jgi:GrpB-like predicted nucleotidyltransferase (UPF0157 family)
VGRFDRRVDGACSVGRGCGWERRDDHDLSGPLAETFSVPAAEHGLDLEAGAFDGVGQVCVGSEPVVARTAAPLAVGEQGVDLEGDDVAHDGRHLGPALEVSVAGQISAPAALPLLPGSEVGVSRVERQCAAGNECPSEIGECGVPLLVVDESLSDVPDHGRGVECLVREAGGRALNPGDELGAWLVAGRVEEGGVGVDTGHNVSYFGHGDRGGSGPAPEIDDAGRWPLVHDGEEEVVRVPPRVLEAIQRCHERVVVRPIRLHPFRHDSTLARTTGLSRPFPDGTAVAATTAAQARSSMLPCAARGVAASHTRAVGVSASGPVEVVDYDPAWVQRFADHASRIRGALGATVVRVDHIGSTAVPGLAAKPVIDVQVSVPDLAALDQYQPGLESLGYVHRPHPENDEAREFFRPPGPRVVHVHVVGTGSVEERRYLLHRDFLRAHPAVASDYGDLKKRLAGAVGGERQDYQWGKNPFLQDLQRKAEHWAITTSWSPLPGGSKEER